MFKIKNLSAKSSMRAQDCWLKMANTSIQLGETIYLRLDLKQNIRFMDQISEQTTSSGA